MFQELNGCKTVFLNFEIADEYSRKNDLYMATEKDKHKVYSVNNEPSPSYNLCIF